MTEICPVRPVCSLSVWPTLGRITFKSSKLYQKGFKKQLSTSPGPCQDSNSLCRRNYILMFKRSFRPTCGSAMRLCFQCTPDDCVFPTHAIFIFSYTENISLWPWVLILVLEYTLHDAMTAETLILSVSDPVGNLDHFNKTQNYIF